jgi:hypothetical protein
VWSASAVSSTLNPPKNRPPVLSGLDGRQRMQRVVLPLHMIDVDELHVDLSQARWLEACGRTLTSDVSASHSSELV